MIKTKANPGAEYNGASLNAFILALGHSQGIVQKILGDVGLDSIDPQRWYDFDLATEIYYKIVAEVGPSAAIEVGRKIIEAAEFPPQITSVEDVLMSFDAAYRLNVRGIVPGQINCTLEDDCVCGECSGDSFCSSPDNCNNDGLCDPYNEGCACADCEGHPQCLPICGDGVAASAGDEACDGDDLGGQTCVSAGFDGGGVLGCDDACALVTDECLADEVCGDGFVGKTEVCEGEENLVTVEAHTPGHVDDAYLHGVVAGHVLAASRGKRPEHQGNQGQGKKADGSAHRSLRSLVRANGV